MPSPSASSKFVLSVLQFLDILKILSYTQNILGILKWACLKNFSVLKPNFEEADGLGKSHKWQKLVRIIISIILFS